MRRFQSQLSGDGSEALLEGCAVELPDVGGPYHAVTVDENRYRQAGCRVVTSHGGIRVVQRSEKVAARAQHGGQEVAALADRLACPSLVEGEHCDIGMPRGGLGEQRQL